MVLGIGWAVEERIFGSRQLPYAVGDNKRMDENIHIGERVKVFLDSKFGNSAGWFDGIVVRIDPYSKHRNFYWVELDVDTQALLGIRQISVFNPKNIQKLEPE
jgi:hypothetical protein